MLVQLGPGDLDVEVKNGGYRTGQVTTLPERAPRSRPRPECHKAWLVLAICLARASACSPLGGYMLTMISEYVYITSLNVNVH
jgi:hypothetical protein